MRYRPHRVLENPLPNTCALHIAFVYRRSKMNPCKDTGCTIFSRCFGEAPKLAGDARVGCAARHREADQICAEKPGHRSCRSSPEHSMSRGVIRYRRGPKVTQPFSIAAFANGSDRPPVVVIVFAFETADEAIRQREIHQRKESGILPQVELPCRRHFACDPVPPPGGTLEPIPGDLALFGCACDTLAAADRLDLFNIGQSKGTVHRWRFGTAELCGRRQHKWTYAAPLHHECRRKVGRCRAVFARLCTRGVLDPRARTVVLTRLEDCNGSNVPSPYTRRFSRVIGDGAKHFLHGRVTTHFRVW